MIPSAFVAMDALPLDAERKDRSARAARAGGARRFGRGGRPGERPSRRCSRARGPRCSGSRASVLTTISSISAGTRSWRRRSSRASAPPSAWTCRCAPCSRRPRRPSSGRASSGRSARAPGPRGAPHRPRAAHRPAGAVVRAGAAVDPPPDRSGRSVVRGPGRHPPRRRARRGRRGRVLDEVVRRHEVLRTRYGSADGHPQAIVDEGFRLELRVARLADLPEAEREAALHEAIAVEMRRPSISGPRRRSGRSCSRSARPITCCS